jgi:hypothetical protein
MEIVTELRYSTTSTRIDGYMCFVAYSVSMAQKKGDVNPPLIRVAYAAT